MSLQNIDWQLFHEQKDALVRLIDDDGVSIEQAELFTGILNLLDAVQDEFEPFNIDEEKE